MTWAGVPVKNVLEKKTVQEVETNNSFLFIPTYPTPEISEVVSTSTPVQGFNRNGVSHVNFCPSFFVRVQSDSEFFHEPGNNKFLSRLYLV